MLNLTLEAICIALVVCFVSLKASATSSTCPDSNDRFILIDGEQTSLDKFSCETVQSHDDDDNEFHVSVIRKEKNLLYIQNFLQSQEVDDIIKVCSDPDRLDASPLLMHSATKQSSYATDNAIRTSASCPLLFAHYYMPHKEKLKKEAPQLLPELELTWNISTRAANFLQVPTANIEPLQMLQYKPGQYYKPHHDHRAFYDLMSGYPDRASTMLLFLNDVESGGHLKFDRLGLEFVPRKGDAVVWSNLDLTTGKVDHDMVHQGMPPHENSVKMAINLWVREEPLTSPQQAATRQT